MTFRALTSLPLCIALCCVVSTTQGQILINTIDTGTPDYVELYNCGAASVDISGWPVQTVYDTGGGDDASVTCNGATRSRRRWPGYLPGFFSFQALPP